MKATKKIVGAACALVAATALAAGSTFAWFSNNGTVTAKGLRVDVNTSNSYLVIGNESSELRPASESDTNFKYKTNIALLPGTMAADGTITPGTATKLLPAAYDETLVTAGADGADSTVSNDITTAAKWYTAKGTSPTDGTLLEGSKVTLDKKTDFGAYVVVDDVFVSVAVGSDAVTDVQMTLAKPDSFTIETGKTADAINIVVLYRTANFSDTGDPTTWNMVELKGDSSTKSITNKSLGGVSESTYIHVKVMIYLDGNNELVRSNNAKNLSGYAVDLTFTDAGFTED